MLAPMLVIPWGTTAIKQLESSSSDSKITWVLLKNLKG
jgi:hypothetical protein